MILLLTPRLDKRNQEGTLCRTPPLIQLLQQFTLFIGNEDLTLFGPLDGTHL